MLFNSLAFAVFLPIAFLLYWCMPHRIRWSVVLVAGIYFYLGFGLRNFMFLALVTLVSYFCALKISQNQSEKKEGEKKAGKLTEKTAKNNRIYLWSALALSIGILLIFKYYNFVGSTVSELLSLFTIQFTPAVLKIAAPVGISFYTFKIVSYMIDVHKGKIKAEKNLGKYAAYVSFFPQVASGPIERAASFFEALEEEKKFEYSKGTYALKLMAWGFFKKMIIADKLAGYVNKVYADVENYDGFAFVIVAVLFSIQIYCDFSGYSDIANGTARLLGFNGAENFKSPYFATSIKEFWGRWHISLSTWFRDYIYIPLGGSRVGIPKYIRNIMTTFLVSGLWHGASWNFVVWGGLHGAVQVIETLVTKRQGENSKGKCLTEKYATDEKEKISSEVLLVNKDDKNEKKAPESIAKEVANTKHKMIQEKTGIKRWVSIIWVFVFATIAWIFFQAHTISDALYVIAHMLSGITSPVAYIKGGFSSLGINSGMFIHIVIIIMVLLAYDFISLKRNVIELIGKLPVAVRWIIYVLFIDLMIIWFLQYGADSSSFVYFEF